MDSRKRTQILYDDPNSMFKASKKIYLHELKGATLKTAKQFPDDVKTDLKNQDLMSSLIRDLSQIQNIVEYFYTAMYEAPMLINAFSLSSMRDANKILGYINVLLKQLRKVKPETFNEDDVYTLYGFFTDLTNKIQGMADYEENQPLQDPFFNQIKFKVFMDKVLKMLLQLGEIMTYLNVSGSAILNIDQQNIQNVPPPPPPPPPGEPDGYDPDVDDEMEGAGRFRVLSKRIRKQQTYPFKRFM